MKALVIDKNDLKLEDLALGPLGSKSARVRVRTAGICATDIHVLSGQIKFHKAATRVLGHEVAGEVESIGSEVGSDWVGKRVIVDPVIGCGECFMCRSGRKLLCRNGGELGTTGGDGGYAEYVTVPVANLYPIPEPLSFDEGSLIEPLNCTYGAFLKASPRPGESVIVFGSGPAGLLFVQLARAFGCNPIFLVGGGAKRLERGRNLGAAEAWDYRDPELSGHVSDNTSGEGADIVVEASGTDAAVRHTFNMVRPGGRVVLYGISGAQNPNIPSDLIVGKDLMVVTGIGSPLLWDGAINLACSGKIDLRSMISHQFSLDDFGEALAVARDPDKSIKVVFHP
jgi:threonine dehydrogenase-like Zn-dependent dehydrogenase